MKITDSMYIINVVEKSFGFQIYYDFPTIKSMRTSGILDKKIIYTDMYYVLKYIQKYIVHYPIKDITWIINLPYGEQIMEI